MASKYQREKLNFADHSYSMDFAGMANPAFLPMGWMICRSANQFWKASLVEIFKSIVTANMVTVAILSMILTAKQPIKNG